MTTMVRRISQIRYEITPADPETSLSARDAADLLADEGYIASTSSVEWLGGHLYDVELGDGWTVNLIEPDTDQGGRILSTHATRDEAAVAGRAYLRQHPDAWIQIVQEPSGQGEDVQVDSRIIAEECA